MKIVLISMVRNEADAIEVFARYYAEIVDEILITDHHSLDDTPEILSELAAEGLPIKTTRIEDAGFHQSRHTTQMMKRACSEASADWVFPLDADEFLTSATGKNVRATVEQFSPDAPAKVFWRSYVPTDDDPVDEPNLLRRVTCRVEDDSAAHHKLLIPRWLAGHPKTSLSPGNHRLIRQGWRRASSVEAVDIRELRLAHFPLRTCEQATVKGLLAWPNVLANESYRPSKFWNQQRMFDEILRGDATSTAWLTRYAASYAQAVAKPEDLAEPVKLVHDPVREPAPIELRWPNPRTVNPLMAVSDTAVELGKQLGELLRSKGR